jgi:hypothetical protein
VGDYTKRALTTYFDYDTILHHIYRTTMSDQLWNDTIRQEVEAGRPVLYCALDRSSSGADAGHAFVIDGYDSTTNLFHVNWGWNGGYDGWYDLYNSELNPAGYHFTSIQVAVIGIQPAPPPEPEPDPDPDPDATGINLSDVTCNTSFRVFPSPASSAVNVVLNDDTLVEMQNNSIIIRSVTGRLMNTALIRQSDGNTFTIDVSSYPAGLYFCTIDGRTAKFAVIR